MTCIAAVAVPGVGVVMGGDSAAAAGWQMTVRSDAKVWERDGWVFGFTSSFRMGQLLRYRFDRPPWGGVAELEEYMATAFADAVRSCLKDGGYTKVEHGREEGGDFLVGTPTGRLFRVCEDFQVGEAADGCDAVGCGGEAARGAMLALADMIPPTVRVRRALEIAERCSAGVRSPFTIVETLHRGPGE